MDPEEFESQGMPGGGAGEGDGMPGEDARPDQVRDQAMPEAELEAVPPRLREQALPEKDDDRFFDRWVVDKARALGFRAVRPPALDRLRQTVRTFAEWRSLRHRPDAERESMADKALVASTPERIKHAQAEAVQLEAAAEKVEAKADQLEREAEDAKEGYFRLRPALRGKHGMDLSLASLANLAVLGADFFIIQVALETIPGTPDDRLFTAALLGAGAVVVGDVLGWIAAAGSVRRDGTMRFPNTTTVIAVASIFILAVWFFGELGDFREAGLEAARDKDTPALGSPTFFTIAQILFLIGAAAVSFAFVARRPGSELHLEHRNAIAELGKAQATVKALRDEAEAARRRATAAPAQRLAAEERIRSREKIAKDRAQRDLKQGEYLDSLVIPEYMHERAGAETGIGFWQIGESVRWERLRLSPGPALGIGLVATLAAGGVAYWMMEIPLVAVITALVVAFAYAAVLFGGSGSRTESDGPMRFVARLFPTARKAGERASDIERIEPSEPAEGQAQAGRSGNGNGARRLSHREHEELLERLRELINGERA